MRRFYISEMDKTYLQWITPKKAYEDSRVNLLDIRRIERG
jgi:hypothetical protein